MGQFGFETGRQSPSGLGKYFFNTRAGQDNQVYDLLDRYVMEADAFKQVCGEICYLLNFLLCIRIHVFLFTNQPEIFVLLNVIVLWFLLLLILFKFIEASYFTLFSS